MCLSDSTALAKTQGLCQFVQGISSATRCAHACQSDNELPDHVATLLVLAELGPAL